MALYYKKMVRIFPRLEVGIRYRTNSHWSFERRLSLHCMVDVRWEEIEIGFAIWSFSLELIANFVKPPKPWSLKGE